MLTLPRSLRIGVLRGGPSPEYENSLTSGGYVLRELAETHRPLDIFISRDGLWHVGGIEKSPERILKNVDVVFNALHGSFGEDGQVQELLFHHGVPYTGSDKLASALGLNKQIAKEQARLAGIKTPVYIIVRRENSLVEKAKEIFNSIPHPLAVKPTSGGSSQHFYKVQSFSELLGALEIILSEFPAALVEEYISGKDVSCMVLHNFRGVYLYAFPPVVSDNSILGREDSRNIEEFSRKMHGTLALSHYSQSDFILSPRRGIYFLEVNTVPKIHTDSPLIKSLAPVGVSIREFLHHLIGLAINRK